MRWRYEDSRHERYILRKEYVRYLLKEKGLKQKEVSLQVWKSVSALGSQLNNKEREIKYETAVKLAEVLGIDVNKIVRKVGLLPVVD